MATRRTALRSSASPDWPRCSGASSGHSGVGVTLLCPPNMDTPGYAREVATEPRETAAINGIAKTVDPSEVAREFLRGIERGRFLLLHGMSNRLLYRIGGLWPELFYWIFDGKVAAVRREEVRSDDVH